MTIDWNKPVQTRDGSEVNIYTTSAKAGNKKYPVRGEVLKKSGFWSFESWTPEGEWSACAADSDLDLVNVPEKHVRYFNMYPDSGKFVQPRSSRDEADAKAAAGRIACVRVEFEEGQFDD